jgi:glycogen synthase
MRIAIASRELYPLSGGGIGRFVASAARLLSRTGEVTILTTSLLEESYRRLHAAGDERLPGDEVRVAFVPEPTPEEAAAWVHRMHCYSARLYERLRELYPDRPPDVIEFPDFLGEAFVTVQAKHALDPFLRPVAICVRIHTTVEICEVLDGYFTDEPDAQAVRAMERFSLANADRLIHEGGDVLGTYQRFYGSAALAAATRIRYPYLGPSADLGSDSSYEPPSRLRILYLGRLERRKGVQNLVSAATGLRRDDFHLTLVGADTPTGPLGTSMRECLLLDMADDERISLGTARPAEEIETLVRGHDAVVLPSLWECWPYAALEALHLNRPILATPVGGLLELARPDASGWLARGSSRDRLKDALDDLLDRREELQVLLRGDRPSSHAQALSADREIVDSYQALARRPQPRRASRADAPLVSAVVPYYRLPRFLPEAIASLIEQDYPRLEIVVVNDGSFDGEDSVLAKLAARLPITVVTQMNSGLGSARNLGVLRSSGRYFFPLDADNAAEPDFVRRCVEVLEERPDVAYVTSWSRYVDEEGTPWDGPTLGYAPLGNHATLNAEQNVAGDAAAVIRRRLFDAGFRYSEELTSFEDWHFYRELQRAGHLGAVIPERLLRYRVRGDSMRAMIAEPNLGRLMGEIDARILESGTQWSTSSA